MKKNPIEEAIAQSDSEKYQKSFDKFTSEFHQNTVQK